MCPDPAFDHGCVAAQRVDAGGHHEVDHQPVLHRPEENGQWPHEADSPGVGGGACTVHGSGGGIGEPVTEDLEGESHVATVVGQQLLPVPGQLADRIGGELDH